MSALIDNKSFVKLPIYELSPAIMLIYSKINRDSNLGCDFHYEYGRSRNFTLDLLEQCPNFIIIMDLEVKHLISANYSKREDKDSIKFLNKLDRLMKLISGLVNALLHIISFLFFYPFLFLDLEKTFTYIRFKARLQL